MPDSLARPPTATCLFHTNMPDTAGNNRRDPEQPNTGRLSRPPPSGAHYHASSPIASDGLARPGSWMRRGRRLSGRSSRLLVVMTSSNSVPTSPSTRSRTRARSEAAHAAWSTRQWWDKAALPILRSCPSKLSLKPFAQLSSYPAVRVWQVRPATSSCPKCAIIQRSPARASLARALQPAPAHALTTTRPTGTKKPRCQAVQSQPLPPSPNAACVFDSATHRRKSSEAAPSNAGACAARAVSAGRIARHMSHDAPFQNGPGQNAPRCRGGPVVFWQPQPDHSWATLLASHLLSPRPRHHRFHPLNGHSVHTKSATKTRRRCHRHHTGTTAPLDSLCFLHRRTSPAPVFHRLHSSPPPLVVLTDLPPPPRSPPTSRAQQPRPDRPRPTSAGLDCLVALAGPLLAGPCLPTRSPNLRRAPPPPDPLLRRALFSVPPPAPRPAAAAPQCPGP